MRRTLLHAALLATLLASAMGLAPAAAGAATPSAGATAAPGSSLAAGPGIRVSLPGAVSPGLVTALTLTLPAAVAALDGRLVVDHRAATLVGVAVPRGATGLAPVSVADGYAFGAYGLSAAHGLVSLELVILPRRAGRLSLSVAIDSLADGTGHALAPGGGSAAGSLAVGPARRALAAPAALAAPRALRPATAAPAELLPDGRIDRRDLDLARAGWTQARQRGRVCAASGLPGDADGDGCVSSLDLQATLAASGRRVPTYSAPAIVRPRAAAGLGMTITVSSAADTPDAVPGDGICADAQDRCTLRAAMTEADRIRGDDVIRFDLPGPAPVTIQLTSRLPYITSRAGTMTIDGYSQPGARVNSSTVGSDAVPGVEIRGNGNGAREVGFYVTSMGNTIRGLLIDTIYRGILLDGPDAHDNRIIGDWIGFTKAGGNAAFGNFAVVLNTGANHNFIGTPDLADRNDIGNYTHAIENYGAGTNGNIIQNNVLCIGPSGFTTATCSTGIDHNFGPKNDIIGGDGRNEKNVIGPTTLQGIEYSHGWNQALPWGTDTATTYQINGNTVTGNWVGFRGDGSYSAAFRSGLNFSSADNGNGINVYDGSNDNTIQRNYVASVYDGIQTMAPDAHGNTFRGNIIGRSPLGEDAPLAGWGIKVRWATRNDIISNNEIHNAALGGIGLVNYNSANQPQSTAFQIKLSRNTVTDTNGPGIDLFGVAGPDPNDVGDADKGADSLLNTPVITSATTVAVRGTAGKGNTVELYRASRPEGAFGLPVEFLGDSVVAADGTWIVPVSTLQAGDRVASLQIRSDSNTSELSVNVAVTQGPQSGDLIASDDFGRTISGGWGDADLGGTWAPQGSAADFSVASGAGTVNVPIGGSREARLPIGTADVAVNGNISFDRLPGAGNEFAYVLARTGGNSAYRAAIRVNPAGAVFVQLKVAVNNVESNLAPEVPVPGLVVAADAGIAFRLEVVGGSISFRAWDPAGADPGTWLTTTTDNTLTGPGGVGIRAFTGAGVPNGPVNVSVHTFKVRVP